MKRLTTSPAPGRGFLAACGSGLAVILSAMLAHPDAALASHRRHAYEEPDVNGLSHRHREVHLSRGHAVALEINFDAGHLRVRRGAPAGVVVLDLYQSAGLDSPMVSLDEKSGQDRLTVGTGDWSFQHEHGNITIHHDSKDDEDDDADHDDDADDRDHDDHGDGDRHEHARAHRHHGDRDDDDDIHVDARRVWKIRLPSNVEFTMTLATGASSSEVDLSGLAVRDLDIATGAGEMELRFDEANPAPGGMLEIEGGACKFRALGLGNGGFRSVRFAGGVGDFLLDWSGASRDESRAELDVGLGKLRVEVPASLGVKLDATGGGLSHVDVDGLDRHGDSFLSRGYERARHRLILDIAASLGVVEVVQE